MTFTNQSSILETTTLQKVRKEQPKVNSFLIRKGRNSQRTEQMYHVGLAYFQDFLNLNFDSKYTLETILKPLCDKTINVYELLDSFVDFLTKRKISNNAKLSINSIRLYLAAVKTYIESQDDIDINPARFRNKVTVPRNHKSNEEPLDVSDIRKILFACNNSRLRTYILVLASSGCRAVEGLSIRRGDIDFSVSPTKIHIREEFTKTKVARDIYISDEATYHLNQLIEAKNKKSSLDPEHLVFTVKHYKDKEDRYRFPTPENTYVKISVQFRKLLEAAGLSDRKHSMKRHQITLHSFRRFAKSVIANNTNSDYSEWILGHKGSPYFSIKESERRQIYAVKCMPYLTFLDYSKLEREAEIKNTDIQLLMQRDLRKDKEIQTMELQLSNMQEQLQNIISAMTNIKDQKSFDLVAKQYLKSGLLKVDKDLNK